MKRKETLRTLRDGKTTKKQKEQKLKEHIGIEHKGTDRTEKTNRQNLTKHKSGNIKNNLEQDEKSKNKTEQRGTVENNKGSEPIETEHKGTE